MGFHIHDYTIIAGVAKLVEILVNLFIMGIPVMVVRTLDRYRKEWRGWKYYLAAFVLVIAWTQLVFALAGHHILATWLAVLANVVFLGVLIIVVTLVGRYRNDWRGWRYYLLAFAIAVVAQLVIVGIPYYALKKANGA